MARIEDYALLGDLQTAALVDAATSYAEGYGILHWVW